MTGASARNETTHTDPPDMPADERMSPAELKVVREFLGLSGEWLADHVKVSARMVRHWEQGRHPIPDTVRLAVEDLEARTGAFISGIVDALIDIPDPIVITYRTDADYHREHPEIDFPASWHRAVVARVALEVPALQITYREPTTEA